MLNVEERKMVESYMQYYGGAALGINANLSEWERQKKHWLFKMFGNSCILEKEVSYQRSDRELANAFADLNTEFSLFFENLQEYFDRTRHCLAYRLGSCVYNFDKTDDRGASVACWTDPVILGYERFDLRSYLFNKDNLIKKTTENHIGFINTHSITYPYTAHHAYWDTSTPIPYCHNKDLAYYAPIGTKIAKIMNKFVLPAIKEVVSEEEYKYVVDKFEEYCVECSKIYQQSTTTGTLCLSIHPMDYITMSDSGYGWTSCMSWEDNGEYHAGTLEMMTSPYVIVAYLRGSEYCWEESWPGKKWRELFVISEDIIMGIKGYPFHSATLEKTAMEWLRDLAKENLGWTYNNTDIMYTHVDRVVEIENKKVSYRMESNKMYNDCYLEHPCFFALDPEEDVTRIEVNYSGQAIDIIDGTQLAEDIPENFVYNPRHDGLERCESCGYYVYKDDLDEHGYCPDCHYEDED